MMGLSSGYQGKVTALVRRIPLFVQSNVLLALIVCVRLCVCGRARAFVCGCVKIYTQWSNIEFHDYSSKDFISSFRWQPGLQFYNVENGLFT